MVGLWRCADPGEAGGSSPQAIDRLDEVLSWLCPHLTADQRMILWAREGERMRWKRIAFLDAQVNRRPGRSERWLRTIKADAEARFSIG